MKKIIITIHLLMIAIFCLLHGEIIAENKQEQGIHLVMPCCVENKALALDTNLHVLYQGKMYTASFNEGIGGQITIKHDGVPKSFIVVITKNIQYIHDEETALIQGIKINNDQKSVACYNLILDVIKSEQEFPTYSWKIIKMELPPSGKLPDNSLIIQNFPSNIELCSFEKDFSPSLPTIKGPQKILFLPLCCVKGNAEEKVFLDPCDEKTYHVAG